MFIKLSKETFELGDSIPCEIIFVNTSNEKIALQENPTKSIDLVMHAVNIQTHEDLNYSIGTATVTQFGDDKFALTVPVKEAFDIGTKSLFSFISDINARLYLSPGKYECYVINYLVEKSNKLDLTVSLTPASVYYLLKTAVDERETYGKREWAYDWLKKINPELELRLSLDKDSDDKKRESVRFNELAYAKFLKWWECNKKSDAVTKKIQKLNQK